MPLILRVPDYVSLRLKFDQPSQTFSIGGYTYLLLSLPRIPAMSATGDLLTLPIIVKVSDPNRSGQSFRVEATIPKFTPRVPTTGGLQSSPVIGNTSTTGIADKNFRIGYGVNVDGPCGNVVALDPFGFLCFPDEPEPAWKTPASYFPPTPPPPPPPDSFGNAGSIYDNEPVFPQTPSDPNDKTGSVGFGTERFYTGDVALPYVVTFENVDTASLPAQDVVVTDQLDPNVFDFSTFSFNLIAFGDKQVLPLTGVKQFTTDVDLRPGKQAIVRVNGNFNVSTGLITWRFNTLDPTTGIPPQDPQAGFLPPNKTSPEGQGTLLFTVKAKQGLVTGTQIKNRARIVFDVNAAMDTPEWLNTIDTTKPTSSVQALPTNVPYSFPLSWSGTDTGAGVRTYTIYVSADGGAFVPFLTNTAQTSTVVTALQAHHTFSFYSIARDGVGNVEPAKTSAEATTTVSAAAGNPIDDPTFFVSQHYRDFLNRAPDTSGFNFWVGQTTGCGSSDPLVCRTNVSAAFYLSIEFQQTGYLVYRTYKTAYGNIPGKPVPVTRQELLPDMQEIGQSVIVGRDGWEHLLETNKQAYFNDVVTRNRFTSLYPQSLTPEQFVDALNANAGGALSQSERDALVGNLKSGAATRAQTLRAVAEDPDLDHAEFNKAFVLI